MRGPRERTYRAIGLATLAVTATIASGCLSEGQFSCDLDAPCVSAGAPGQCVRGSCAFPDGACASGARWDQSASPELAGQCVPAQTADLAPGPPRDLAMHGPPRDMAMHEPPTGDMAMHDLASADLAMPPCSIQLQDCASAFSGCRWR